ncbi:hypothetical protein [Methylobacterium planeticum]|uniref:Uncharacterized protein n=1 Tax=Methylobacterium planeticum TaxID=2615211 RepID=A0A6N6MHF7_9HYPH|nr:hypothetical protein [Methylobacterium planeticum]KAB1068186.1 hypothetical protein F6X51_27130 [Methylobacterium planeticum]
MNRVIESRLAKLEQGRQERQETHEERLERLEKRPPMTAAESAELDARIEREAIAEFGSLAAAAVAAREKANQTGSLLDKVIALDLEGRAEEEAAHALA